MRGEERRGTYLILCRWRVCWIVAPKQVITTVQSVGSFLEGGANHPYVIKERREDERRETEGELGSKENEGEVEKGEMW